MYQIIQKQDNSLPAQPDPEFQEPVPQSHAGRCAWVHPEVGLLSNLYHYHSYAEQ
jgi:hypothetical protein